MTATATTPLERALRRFEDCPLSTEAAREDLHGLIDDLARKRAEHPGLFFLSDLQMRYAVLHAFMTAAETALADKGDLARIRDFVNILYTLDEDGMTWRNQVLQVSGEPEPSLANTSLTIESLESRVTDAVCKDIQRNAPTVTKEMIIGWCSMIKELEVKRMQVLASASLVAEPDTDDDESQRTATMLRLERSWSNFRRSFHTIRTSPELTHLFAAAHEMQKSAGKPVYLAYLPKRLHMRRGDYMDGRNDFELVDDPEETPVSLDQIADEHEGEMPFADSQTEISTDAIQIRQMLLTLHPREREAVEKYIRDEKLSVAERKAKSRGIERLRKQNA